MFLAMQVVQGLGDFKKPVGPPSLNAPLQKIKPPPIAPPPKELLSTMERPAVVNMQGVDQIKIKSDGNVENASNSQLLPGSARGPPGRGVAAVPYQPTDYDLPESKQQSSGLIKQGLKSAAAPKYVLKAQQKEGGVSMFQAEKPTPEEVVVPADPKTRTEPPSREARPVPPTRPPDGIPEGKPLPPKAIPTATVKAPPPIRPPPDRQEVISQAAVDTVVNPKVQPPTSEPPFKRGYKKPPVVEEVIIRRRDKEHPEFEESSSDEEGGGAGRQPKETPAAKVEDSPSKGPGPVPVAASTPPAAAAAKEIDVAPAEKMPGKASASSTVPTQQAPTSVVTAPPVPKVEGKPPPPVKDALQIQQQSVEPSVPVDNITHDNAVVVVEEQVAPLDLDDNRSDVSGSLASQLISLPIAETIFDASVPRAMLQGKGDYVPPPISDVEGVESKLAKALKGGRLTIRCIEGTGLRKRDDRSLNPRVDPYIKFKLGAADRHPWKQTKVKRKQESNANFDNELVAFDVLDPGAYVHEEEVQLLVEVWNKGTFKDELIGVVTMSATRFLRNPYVSFEENVPIALPGDKTSTSKVGHYMFGCMHASISNRRAGYYVLLYFVL